LTELHKTLEGVLSVFYKLGWTASDFSQVHTFTIRAGTARRNFGISYASLEGRPFLTLAIPEGFSTPIFEGIYSRYLDFNFDIFLLFKHLSEAAPDLAYLLYFDQTRAYLYDAGSQECLIHCTTPDERSERLFPHLKKKKVKSGSLDALLRKSDDQLARELNGWIHLWSAEIGSKTNARRKTMDRFTRKLILARYYRSLFGPEVPQIQFEGFAIDPRHIESARLLASPVQFLKHLFAYFRQHFGLDFFEPKRAELSFLIKAEKHKSLLNRFLLEFNLLAREKFSLEVFLAAWCPEKERLLSTKKTYTTTHIGIKGHIAVEEIMVLKPLIVNVQQDGTPWALYLFDELVQYWIRYNREIAMGKSWASLRQLQLDLFGTLPTSLAKDGCITNIPNHTLATSFRATGFKKLADKERFLSLLTAKCFELWKKYDLSTQPLRSIGDVFTQFIL